MNYINNSNINRDNLREVFKNRGMTAITEYVYKNVLQGAGWALPRLFLCIHEFFLIIRKVTPPYIQNVLFTSNMLSARRYIWILIAKIELLFNFQASGW
jgi:hypothetical protein